MNHDVASWQCPFPFTKYPHITLAHGAGGKLTQQLIDDIFLPIFNTTSLQQGHDGAVVTIQSEQLAMTTDSYVVSPLFFPGGDIGQLSITGTLNDLAMCGAIPKYISCGFILEEGLSTTTLVRVVKSMQKVAQDNHVEIIAGDTKVIEAKAEPMLFINTTGIGAVAPSLSIGPHRIQAGDKILLNGDIGRHEMAVIAEREELAFEHSLESDCASLVPMVKSLLNAHIDLHCLRDVTRGGLATICNELSKTSGLAFKLFESNIVVSQAVHAGCEILGFDPYFMANEGRCVVIVPDHLCEQTLTILQQHPLGKQASCIGEVISTSSAHGDVTLVSQFGTERLLSPMLGNQLPRIC